MNLKTPSKGLIDAYEKLSKTAKEKLEEHIFQTYLVTLNREVSSDEQKALRQNMQFKEDYFTQLNPILKTAVKRFNEEIAAHIS